MKFPASNDKKTSIYISASPELNYLIKLVFTPNILSISFAFYLACLLVLKHIYLEITMVNFCTDPSVDM